MDIYNDASGHRIITDLTPEISRWACQERNFLERNIPVGMLGLDVGCGRSRYIDLLPDNRFIGMNHNPTMIKVSAGVVGRRENVGLILADATHIPLGDECVDFAMCMSNTLGNIAGEEQLQTLREMRRVSRHFIVLSLYSREAKEAQLRLYKHVGLELIGYDEQFVRAVNSRGIHFSSQRFSPEQIVELMTLAGFVRVSVLHRITDIAYIVVAIPR